MTQDNDALWGNTWLPVVLEALGKSNPEIKGLVLRFEYTQIATATFYFRDGNELTEPLPIFGFDETTALGLPRDLNAFALQIFEEEIVFIKCRYFPLGASADDIASLLKEWKDSHEEYLKDMAELREDLPPRPTASP